MEFTELVLDVPTKNIDDGLRVESRTVRRNPKDLEPPTIEMALKTFEKTSHVIGRWIMIQDLIDQSLKMVVVDNG